jgi:hypothetical protein
MNLTKIKSRLKAAYNSTQFWVWVGMFVGTLTINASSEEMLPVVTEVALKTVAAVSAAMGIRNFIKSKGLKFTWSKAVNSLGYLGNIIGAAVAINVPESFWTDLQEVLNFALAGDWASVMTKVWPLLIILLNLIKENKKEEVPVIPEKA